MVHVREVTPEDRPMLDAAAQADPWHREVGLTGEHWLGGLLYEDENGPVFGLQTQQVARVDIQFVTQERLRNAEVLAQGFWSYISVLRGRGIKEVIFTSNSRAVIRFFEKRFHFRLLGGNTYSLRIL